MKPDPRPFMGTERMYSLKASPKNWRKMGSSPKGKGDTLRLLTASTSMFTTAGDVSLTMVTMGFAAWEDMARAGTASAAPRASAQASRSAMDFLNLKPFFMIKRAPPEFAGRGE